MWWINKWKYIQVTKDAMGIQNGASVDDKGTKDFKY